MKNNFFNLVGKLSYLKKKFYFTDLFSRIFHKSNFDKFLIIFIVGFASRILVNYFYSVNVYCDFLTPISLYYYVCMSAFIILVHEFVSYFNFSCFSFISGLFNVFIKSIVFIIRMFISMNKRIFFYKLEDIKISSLIKGVKYFFSNRNEATMIINESSTYSKKGNTFTILDSESIKKNSYILEKNGKDGSSKEESSHRIRYPSQATNHRVVRNPGNRRTQAEMLAANERLPHREYVNRREARQQEVIMRRIEAERIARDRWHDGIMVRNGTVIHNGENRELAPILEGDGYTSRVNNNPLSTMEPRLRVDNDPSLSQLRRIDSQNNTQGNNNSTNDNQSNNDSTKNNNER